MLDHCFCQIKKNSSSYQANGLVSGSEDILKESLSGRSSKFSMANFIDQTPASASVSPGEAPFSFTVNYTGIQDTISALFKSGISESVRDNLSKRNLGIIQFEIKPFERRSDFKDSILCS